MLADFLVTASAMTTAAAATYSANRVRQAVETVEEVDRRSRRNRELLVGNPDATDPVIERLERMENVVRSKL